MNKLRFLLISLLCFAACSVHAMSLFDLRADALMARLPELKKSLNLNANQQILWQQSEAKTRSLMRAKELRRIKLDDLVREMVQTPNVELRDIDAKLDGERQAAQLEDQQSHETWLTMFDALDDKQRVLVQEFLYEQLMRSGNEEKSSADSPGTTSHKGRGARNPADLSKPTQF
ncbi:hypothetical protein [Solimicrobium silvestre]|uniref:LTXXQ motif family protein n=1 Tax=Solimicrobium silvestre TaxID=2099400 RepID=A0A2S9GVZ2_9BURK|nr:hypothetical protein [Solimicrobium silvestre]PRC91897.1 hypothetical protein S2091_3453 [Solimicrobium silvestre]